MRFRAGCELRYTVSQATTFLFHIAALETDRQTILHDSIRLQPSQGAEDRVVPTALNRFIRVTPQTGPLAVRYEAEVELNPRFTEPEEAFECSVSELPLEVIPYLYPSRYCPSDELMGRAAEQFGDLEPGYSRVTAICNWIYANIRYERGVSDAHSTVTDTLEQRAGVCRDFAHLGIVFCRALNIPARFLSVYAYGLTQPDFHACFEAYLGGRWYLFDATRLAPLTGFIRLGVGRDAADASFATIFGAAEMDFMQTFVEVTDSADGATEPEWTSRPISMI